MGKKSDNSQPAAPPPPDTSGQEAVLMQMMQAMMAIALAGQHNAFAAPPPPQLPPIPEIVRDPIIDWTEKNQEIANKARADFELDQSRRKGREDTILTSPLLDEQEVTTTSLLADE